MSRWTDLTSAAAAALPDTASNSSDDEDRCYWESECEEGVHCAHWRGAGRCCECLEWYAAALSETAVGFGNRPADATPSVDPRPRNDGSQRPARSSTKPGPELGVTPLASFVTRRRCPVSALPAGWDWRYLPRGTVLHALDRSSSPMARCGGSGHRGDARPTWFGAGSRVERDHAATLPLCGNCLRYINGKGGAR